MSADGPKGLPGRPGITQRVLLALIRGYQLAFGPLYAGSCRFVPSCSAYASEAILRFGAVRGSGLALRRLLRCRPFGGHGLDPVPDVGFGEPGRGASGAASHQ